MPGPYIAVSLRQWLTSLGERCEYCLTSELVTGIAPEVDHIHPHSKGGKTERMNLCRACSSCNVHKGDQTAAAGPETGEVVALFHPRRQNWSEHFVWSSSGTEIVGTTPTGRATVMALKMNNPRIARARELWIVAGWHPPTQTNI